MLAIVLRICYCFGAVARSRCGAEIPDTDDARTMRLQGQKSLRKYRTVFRQKNSRKCSIAIIAAYGRGSRVKLNHLRLTVCAQLPLCCRVGVHSESFFLFRCRTTALFRYFAGTAIQFFAMEQWQRRDVTLRGSGAQSLTIAGADWH